MPSEESPFCHLSPDMFKNEYPTTDDPRMGHLLVPPSSSLSVSHEVNPNLGTPLQRQKPKVALVGFPFDEGVRRNGGRIGAARGPDVAKQFIQKVGTVVNCEEGVDLKASVRMYDMITINAPTLEQGHGLLRERVRELMKNKVIPFVIGGGNDQSFPNAQGFLDALGSEDTPIVINIDAHFDVRPLKDGKVHSGSPFRQLLETDEFQRRSGSFLEFAAQGSQCSAAHVAYLQSKGHGGPPRDREQHQHPQLDPAGTTTTTTTTSTHTTQTKILWLSTVQREGGSQFRTYFRSVLDDLIRERKAAAAACPSSLTPAIFVSFDLDAIRSADAPGVSCASPLGLDAQQALDICYAAGRHPDVRLFDLSEFNPDVEEYRTGRLVAFMFYHFCLGLAKRGVMD